MCIRLINLPAIAGYGRTQSTVNNLSSCLHLTQSFTVTADKSPLPVATSSLTPYIMTHLLSADINSDELRQRLSALHVNISSAVGTYSYTCKQVRTTIDLARTFLQRISSIYTITDNNRFIIQNLVHSVNYSVHGHIRAQPIVSYETVNNSCQ